MSREPAASHRAAPRLLMAAACAAALSGCISGPREPGEADLPRGRPQARPSPSLAAPAPSLPRTESEIYFAEVQKHLLSQGLMRTDGGGEDTPFTDRMLAENFMRIALKDEYSRTGGRFVQAETNASLRRWQEPVRVGITFGASVPEARRATDRARIASYLARLSKITGHPISLTDTGVNFVLHIVNDAERAALGPTLARQLPDLSARDIQDVTQMPRSTYCLVYAQSSGKSGIYQRAIAVVRAEHPDLLRLSCFHEEIAQGLGLPNDSPGARPSIFNDDEEFALLTRMDELMLQMLYAPELRPGMRAEEARPIVNALAARLTGNGTS